MEFWVVVLTVWAFFRWVQSRIQRKKDDERFARVIEALNKVDASQKQFGKLENRIQELERRLASAPASASLEPPVKVVIESPAEKPVEKPTPIKTPPWPEVTKTVASAPPVQPVPLASVPVAPVAAPRIPDPTPASPKPPMAPPAPIAPDSVSSGAVPSLFSQPKKPAVSARERSSDLEQKLGTNWLNKIGIIILVIGISLFLAIKFPSLTNPEKIGLGYLVSLAILGTGIYLERRDRYRVFARALIGGGWALTFFVTYAMHFVTYTRVIETQWIDLVLLFMVATAMVVHTLRYDSQVVTGLAFLLAFTTVAISQNTIYSLSAGLILALGLIAIVYRRKWFELEVFGILASYLNHFVWLAQVIVPMAGRHRIFPEFVPSTILLCLYWVLYRWSYIARRVETRQQEIISTLAAILNTSLLLFLFKYQSVRPEFAFYALLLLGAVEVSLGQLPITRRRRVAFVILSSIGTILLIAAIPFKFSGMDTAIIWLAEAEIFLVAGVLLREVLFRRFGLLVALLTVGDILANQAVPKLFERLSQAIPPADYPLAISFLVAGVLFYTNSLGIPRRWKDLFTSDLEQLFFRALSYLAALMMFVGLWLAFPNAWTAVLWASLAFVLAMLGRRLAAGDLIYQMHVLALAAFVRALVVNSFASMILLNTSGVTQRLLTLSLVVALLYLCARWLNSDVRDDGLHASEIYTTGAALLVAVLAYQECHWAWISIAWGGYALALAILGLLRQRRDFSVQAHVLVLAGFVRTLLYNFDATQEYGHFTLRLITYSLMALLLYLCAYLSGPRDSEYAGFFSALHTWAGSTLIGILAFKDVSSPWIAVVWALFAFLLLVIGDRVKRIQLHFQAYIFTVCSLFQIFAVNLQAIGPFRLFPYVSVRLVTIALVTALYYLASRWAAKGEFSQAPLIGAGYTWCASFLVGLLALYELDAMNVALGWGIFALVLLEIGILRKSLNWRLQSYVGFGMAFFRLAYFNLGTPPHELLFTTLPLAFVFYYGYLRVTRIPGASPAQDAVDQRLQIAPVLAYLGSATLVLFAQFYFRAGPALIAWAALVLLFIAVAWGAKLNNFLHHSVLLAFLVFFRAIAFDFSSAGHPDTVWSAARWFYVAVVAALIFAGQTFAFPIRKRLSDVSAKGGTDRRFMNLSVVLGRPEQIYFFLSMILVTLLIFNEVSQGRTTIAWGIEAVAAFLFALSVGERSFRLAGLGLLMVCVGKIVVLDVWRQERSDRYITLIILGAALLLVSFLYTRYSEAIRQYL